MNEIQYVGETLWIGVVARLLIITGFIGAIFGAASHIIGSKRKFTGQDDSWSRLGHWGLWVHGLSILTVIALIFYAMVTKHYEYNYVFEHVNEELPMKYILSAFWEGQEGSFMLWMFWHIILGFIVFFTDKKWRSPVLAVILMAEAWLNSMLLGIYLPIGDEFKIGSNPMVLIREMTEAPIFSNADYLSLIEGRGLNPLLQNYWNTIHPPTTFLGFASTIMPFAYAFAGLWSKEDKVWLSQGLKWGLFSSGILGIGILMGSLWAYEALSFGGYWAWDPVENTSLVPWIILVAGVHTNLIARNTGHGIKATYIFYLMSFILIIYSTTLTRSGILGDTSAHAFTEMGLEWQLLAFILFFVALSITLTTIRYRSIPSPIKEEPIQSREFWMFVGSLVLLFSGTLITASSSIPVFNTLVKVFDPNYVGGVLKDPITHYNKYQLWIAVFISFLSGIAVFLLYRKEKAPTSYLLRIGIHLSVALLITFFFGKAYELPGWQNKLLAFAGIFMVSANAHYLYQVATQQAKMISTALSHIGFGLLVLGTLTSGLNSYHLNNPFLFSGLSEDPEFAEKYVQLIKGKPLFVRDHLVTYHSDTLVGRERFYEIEFKSVNKDLVPLDSFTLKPNAQYSNDYSKVAAFNPDTKHFFTKDVFSCVVNLPPHLTETAKMKEMEDTLKYTTYTSSIGDTINGGEYKYVIQNINTQPSLAEYQSSNHELGIEINVDVINKKNELIQSIPAAIGLEGSLIYSYPGKIEQEYMRIKPNEAIFDAFLTKEEDLKYEFFEVKKGDKFTYQGYSFLLTGFDKNPVSKNYEAQQGDIAVGAVLEINKDQKSFTSSPMYVIRGTAPMSIKDYIASEGLHIRLSNINPQEEKFTFKIAKDARAARVIPFDVATNVPRSDYIILQATVFPGIKLYWIGGLMMMLGLLWGWVVKLRDKQALQS